MKFKTLETLDDIKGLDIDLCVLEDEAGQVMEWQVWTPNETGACIGSGSNREEALHYAVENLQRAAAGLEALLPVRWLIDADARRSK